MALTADFASSLNNRRRLAGAQRDASLSQNAYSRFLSQQRGSRSLVDLDRGMTRGLQGLGAGYAQRGLGQSGIREQGTSDYATNWMNQKDTITQGIAGTMRQADLGDSAANAQYDSTDADLEAEKNAAIQSTAAQLSSFMPFLGA